MKAKAALEVRVESEPGQPEAMPKQFRLNGRRVEIVGNIDVWHGANYRYFKAKGSDGNLYILRFDEKRAEWELTMFQSPQAEALAAALYTVKWQRPDR
ncbi:MAG: hypothetical protein WBX25_06885 [Rhodomicrobium sp.]